VRGHSLFCFPPPWILGLGAGRYDRDRIDTSFSYSLSLSPSLSLSLSLSSFGLLWFRPRHVWFIGTQLTSVCSPLRLPSQVLPSLQKVRARTRLRKVFHRSLFLLSLFSSGYFKRKADMLEAKQAARLGEEAAALLQASEPAPLHREAAAVKAPPAKKAAVRKLTQASAPAKTNVPAAPAARAVEQQAACCSAVSAVAPASTPMQLTEEQKARIERNGQQALAIRATKV
jgi:hypothetical protein